MRVAVVASAISLCIVGISAADDTSAAIKRHTDIPAERLDRALQALAANRGLAMAYRSELVGDRQTQGASGDLTRDEALTQVLSGTGLTYRFLDEQTVTIVPTDATDTGHPTDSLRSQEASKDSEQGQKQSFWDRFRVAQLDQEKSSSVTSVRELTSTSQENSKSPSGGLEEIVVTAQKRQERLFDVPMSIVAMTGDELEKRNITNIDDLTLAVPGISGLASSGYNRQIFIRGASNLIGNASLVGVYLDELNVTAFPSFMQPDIRTYDLDRVEVLKGPQGTLYGEGSVGGTIRFITKNPQLNSFALDADVAALFTEDGAPSQRIQSMVNVPLIENELGVRIVGTFDHEGGWIDQPAAGVTDYNSQNLVDVRSKLLWQPSSYFNVNIMALIHRNDSAPDYGEDANGNFTQDFGLTTTPRDQDDFEIYGATLTYDLPVARLTSATSYLNADRHLYNNGEVVPLMPSPGTEPFEDYLPERVLTQKNLSQEVRLTSVGSSPWEWTIGGFYRRASAGDEQPLGDYFALPTPSNTLPLPFNFDNTLLSKAWAIFGDTSYKLAGRLTLGAGARFFRDNEDFTIAGGTQEGKFQAVSPRAYVQYGVSDQINTYVSASKGFRSGGFNSMGQPTYGPESIWTYELGTKMSFLQGRLSFNPALFYSSYTGYQVPGYYNVGNVLLSVTGNGGNALMKGIELALDWRLAAQWTLSVNGDYLKTAFTSINAGDADYALGDALDHDPKYGFSVSVQHDFTCVASKACFARLDYNQQGRSTYRQRSIGPWYFSESDVIYMLNFNVGLQWNENLSLGTFAQNLLNDRGYVSSDVIERYAARSRPRTVGLRLSFKFD